MNESNLDYQFSPTVTNDELNDLFANAWENIKRGILFNVYNPIVIKAVFS